MMEQRFNPEVENVLRAAGWFPGRQVSQKKLEEWEAIRPLFPAAHRVLREFGNLEIPYITGPNMGHDDELALSFDPFINWEPDSNESMAKFEEEFGCRLYPLGVSEAHLGFYKGERLLGYPGNALILDERGRLFCYFYGLGLIGNTFDKALCNFILHLKNPRWQFEAKLWDIRNDKPA
jgi:hypothetical protein